MSALAAPGAPIAETPSAPIDPDAEQTTVPAPPTAPPAAIVPAPPPSRAPAAPSEAAQAPPEAPPPDRPPAPPATPEGPTPDSPAAFAATPGSVTIQDYSFGPATVTVNVGESVTWRNDGPSTHSATSTGGGFDTGLLARGESGSATFDEAGTFSYICTPHPSMKATVRVVAQAAGDDTSDDDGSSSGAGTTGDTDGSSTDPGAEPDGEQLPETGADPLWLAVTGAGLLLIGGSGMRRRSWRVRS
jgi:LPXTG-motif cell wall-anchored protein